MVQKQLVFVLVLASCVITAALTVTLTMLLDGRGMADSQTLMPPCPQTGYGADGNMGPEFCMVENPIAVRYFAPMAPQTFALGPNASPWEVTDAIVADS